MKADKQDNKTIPEKKGCEVPNLTKNPDKPSK